MNNASPGFLQALPIPAFLKRFLAWLKQPSNLLSVAAIVAVVIVPWVERIAKADEELRSQIDTLLASTNKVISLNQQQPTSYSDSDMLSRSLVSAQRDNELSRANAIADRIRHDVYPAVLFALSNELCASGKYEDAHNNLQEVLGRGTGLHIFSERPSNDELSQAHALIAKCYVQQSGGNIKAEDKRRVEVEMASAVAVLGRDNDDRTQGELALTYAEWSQAEDRMQDPSQAQTLATKASEIAKKMRFPDPIITALIVQKGSSNPPTAPMRIEENLPRSSEGDSYLVTFPRDPNDEAVLIFPPPDKNGAYVASGSLYLYRHGLFVGSDEVISTTHLNDKTQLTRIDFIKEIPTPPVTVSGRAPPVDMEWTIATMDTDTISGIQSQIGHAPVQFVARRSVHGTK